MELRKNDFLKNEYLNISDCFLMLLMLLISVENCFNVKLYFFFGEPILTVLLLLLIMLISVDKLVSDLF